MTRSHRAHAFTLVELVTSMTIASILMMAMTSALVVASHALPTDSDPARAKSRGGEALRLVADEIAAAKDITRATSSDIVFTLDDRDGDGAAEVVRYHWDGNAGDPLVRTARGVESEVMAVDAFELTYRTASESQFVTQGPSVGEEELLVGYSDTVNRSGFNLSDVAWYGQTIAPPQGDLDSWRITRVRGLFRQASGVTSEKLYVGVYALDLAGRPTGAPLQEEQVQISLISTAGGGEWVEITFSTPVGLSPDQSVALLYSADAGADTTPVRIFLDDATTGEMTHATGNAGSHWLDRSGEAPVHEVFTEATASGWTADFQRTHVHLVGLALTPVGSTPLATDAITLNAPELLSAVWQTDFACDPTSLDLDLDSNPDWSLVAGAAFDASDLVDGAWPISSTIGTNPANGFTSMTTIDATVMPRTGSGKGGLEVYFDVDDSEQGFARIEIDKPSTYYVLTLQLADEGGTLVEVYREIIDASTDVRLVVVPNADLIALWVAGVHRCNFAYERSALTGDSGVRVWAESPSTQAMIDNLRVAIGGTATVTSN